MASIIAKRPLTSEQKERITARTKPSLEEMRAAADALLMNLYENDMEVEGTLDALFLDIYERLSDLESKS